jgi:Tol biopolymer transport system component
MVKVLPITSTLLFTGLILTACTNNSDPISGLSEPGTGILFVSDRDEDWEIYVVQPDKTGLFRLTNHPNVDSDPSWFPDGSWIAFRSRRDGSSDIFRMRPDGSDAQNLVKDEVDSFFDEFSYRIAIDGSNLLNLTDHPSSDFLPDWSPNQ